MPKSLFAISPEGRHFLRRGGHLSLSMMLVGLTGLIFSTGLMNIDTTIVTAFGLGWSLYAMVVLPFTGFRLLALRSSGTLPELLSLKYAAVSALAVMTIIYFLLAWIFIFRQGGEMAHLLSHYIFIRAIGFPIDIATNLLAGTLIKSKKEKVMAATTMHSIVVQLCLLLWIVQFSTLGDRQVIDLIASFNLALGLYVFIRYIFALDPAHRKRIWDNVVARTPINPKVVGATLVSAVAGSSDVVVLSTTFFIVLSLLAPVDAAAAAATTFGIALVRTVVVPIKSFGTVAGRSLLDQIKPETRADLHREYMRVMQLICRVVTLGFAVLAATAPYIPLFAPTFIESGGQFVLFAIAVQFLLEPYTGFRAAMLKVTVSPSATLLELALALWLLALPLLLMLRHVEALNLISVWVILVTARLVFLLLIRWRVAGKAHAFFQP